jgi:hypothetical protein
MDGERFDRFARTLATQTSRRHVLSRLAHVASGAAASFFGKQASTIEAAIQPTDEDVDRCIEAANELYEERRRECGAEWIHCVGHAERWWLIPICDIAYDSSQLEAIEVWRRAISCCPFEFCGAELGEGFCCTELEVCCGSECLRGDFCCPDGGACRQGQQCCGGSCCPEGEICCDGECCLSDQVCCGGVTCCGFIDCQPGGICCPGQQFCDGDCVELQSDPYNCGACDNFCDPVLYRCCRGICTEKLSFETDSANCGECGHVCESCTECVAGRCEPIDCGSPCLACVDNSCESTCGEDECCTASGCFPSTVLCLPDESCCGETCCAAGEKCCGDRCCYADEQCCGDGLCCPNDATCCGTNNCCYPEESCCPGEFCCLPGDQCCGEECCFGGLVCFNGQCCPSDLGCV